MQMWVSVQLSLIRMCQSGSEKYFILIIKAEENFKKYFKNIKETKIVYTECIYLQAFC